MIFELIIAIVFSRYLQKTLQTSTLLPKSDKILVAIRNVAIVLLVVGFVIKVMDPVTPWLTHALLLYFVYILYSHEEFSSARPVLLAIAPFILLSIITDVLKLTNTDEYHTWKSLIGLAYVFSGIWLVVFWINTNKQKKALAKEQKKTNEEIEQKKILASLKDNLEMQVTERTAELTKQKEELEQTVVELKSTQALLIQSEKMASLGELTAGIAHEIQNPLNFVNNFAEVNSELIDEIVEEIQAGNKEEALLIARDIRDNELKISYHGKRAEAIVKGMLQHSRTSSGLKEPVNINELADEYLRLSYHGLRSKDNSLVASYKTDFDPSIGTVNIIEQDIGRVLLNLYNNAFYAVTERRKMLLQGQPEGVKLTYEPTVTVKTQKRNGKVEISVTDNGNGIPVKILDKIFQPFFTTKPTGQGTGLGLSLSYDIVKAHGGELKVNTKELQEGDLSGLQPFTKFTVLLPLA